MSARSRVVPVHGVTEMPDLRSLIRERPGKRSEGFLLNVTTVIAVVVVSCAWILLALD